MKTVENLIDPLIVLTEQDKLRWKTLLSPQMFIVNLPNNLVKVWQWTDDNDTDGVSIQLLDLAQNPIDRVIADQFNVKYEKYLSLFDTARRSANNVDSIIKSIENDFLIMKSG